MLFLREIDLSKGENGTTIAKMLSKGTLLPKRTKIPPHPKASGGSDREAIEPEAKKLHTSLHLRKDRGPDLTCPVTWT